MNLQWLLLAQSDAAAPLARRTLEFGRIENPADWILPGVVAVAMGAYVVSMYRRDSAELSRWVGWLLTALRLGAIAALAVVYLQPQWRTERSLVENSRVVLLVDTSLSMGLADDESSASTTGAARNDRVAAALAETDFVERLRRTHDVVVVRFDEALERLATLEKRASSSPTKAPRADAVSAEATAAASDVDWAAALAARGAETRLGQSLRQLLTEERSAPLAGVVVFTDGQQNAGADPATAVELARDAGAPLFTVGLGSNERPANVRVSDLVAPQRAYPGDAYTVTGYVQAQGQAGAIVRTELLSRDAAAGAANADAPWKSEAAQQATLGADGEALPVRFELKPEETGRKTLMFRVSTPDGDPFPNDNQQEVDVEIVDRKTRVLLFAGGPSREYQFLRNQLRRDKEIIVDVLLQSAHEGVSQDAHEILDAFPATREELFEYDCIVAFDPDWRELTAGQIDMLDDWVAKQAGGLVLIAGPINTDRVAQDPALVKIRALYPIEFHRRVTLLEDGRYGSKEPWPVELTREGLEAEFLWLSDSAPTSARAWEEFPGVFGYFSARGVKPGATVYGRYSDPRAAEGGEQPPYIAGQFFGAGRVLYLGSGEMWRLRSVNDAYFETLYTKLVRSASQGRLLRGSSHGVLLVERDRYLLGNTVAVRAQLTDARLEPLEVPEVAVEAIAPDGQRETVKLVADAAVPGSYAGQFTVRQEGAYRLELSSPADPDDKLTRRIQVRVPDLERETPQRNDALLADLATKTDGAYYVGVSSAIDGSESAPGVIERLRDQSRTTILLGAPVRLWDNAWMLGIVCGLLCSEWLVRRLVRLA